MVSTPKKKRTASIAISPLKVSSVNDIPLKTRAKKKSNKTYQFAPLNNLSSGEPVLKSIPISKVRNADPALKAKGLSGKARVQPQSKVKENNVLGSCKVHPDRSPETRYSDGPSEEVIWRYSPRRLDEQIANHYDLADESDNDDSMNGADIRGQSSTPLINDKFKDLIGCDDINEEIPIGTHGRVAQGSPIKKAQREMTPIRDINEILNDLEGPKTLPPSSPVGRENSVSDEATSKPSQVPILNNTSIKEANKNSFSIDQPDMRKSKSPVCINIDSDESDKAECKEVDEEEDDDSLIDILTQRFTKPSFKDMDDQSSQSQEDSLLELLEEEMAISQNNVTTNSQKQSQLQTRKRLERVEVVLEPQEEYGEESVNPKSNQSVSPLEQEDEIIRYAKLAEFPYPQKGFQRLCIYDIKELKTPLQIILTCINQHKEKINIILREPWVRYKYEKGMIIHLIAGENFPNKRLLSNDKDPKTGLENDNLLIVYPDVLLSATMIGTAMDCERRAVLSARLNEPGEYSMAATLGNIIHSLIQELLRLKLLQPNQFISKGLALEVLDKIIKPFTTEVNMCNESVDSAVKTITDEHLPFIIEFVNTNVTKENARSCVQVIGSKNKRKLSVSDIIDIEENIWSAKYGLKGYIDVTVETNVDNDGKRLLAPIEIKTGKWKSNAHEAQGLIYTLLLQDRYDIPVNAHMMLYTKLKEFSLQPKVLNSLKHLLNLRNKLAKYLQVMNQEMSDWGGTEHELPEMIQSSKCDQCFSKNSCMVLNKLSDKEQMPGLLKHEYSDLTRHLEGKLQLYRFFYRKYDRLLMMEETSVVSLVKDTFLMSGEDRELQTGYCVSELRLSNVQNLGQRYLYTFTRDKQKNSSNSRIGKDDNPSMESLSMLSSNIHQNDYVMISDNITGQLAVGTGHVVEIAEDFMVVSCARNILANNIHGDSFNRDTRQVVRSVLMNQSIQLQENTKLTSQRYRIDKNESATGLALARYNLLNLFLPEVLLESGSSLPASGEKSFLPAKQSLGGYSRGRNLIVELNEPQWVKNVTKLPTISDDFNAQQQKAIERSLTCRDYNLILGMPGTGKTSVICELVSILVGQGKSVLVTSYTNSAVDNIMMKLIKRVARSKMVRLGSKSKVHELIKPYCISELYNGENENMSSIIDGAQVVGVTCLGINDPWLQLRTGDFHYVILDEASQVSLPVAIGPLRFGYKFILVGDHYQLPPLVKNKFAQENGLQESLFERLCRTHPQSVVELQEQYRMNQEIMSLSNILIYEGKLRCGTNSVRDQRLEFPDNAVICKMANETTLLHKLIDPNRPVVIFDHDAGWDENYGPEQCQEQNDHGQICNVGEARIVDQIVRKLLEYGIQDRQIGVMSMYKAQMSLLRTTFEDTNIEVLTADQFQGRDKDCIVVSMVRSNPDQSSGVLLRDIRRMNVAMSRAKKKLIVVCSWQCVSAIHSLKPFINHVVRNNWVLSRRDQENGASNPVVKN